MAEETRISPFCAEPLEHNEYKIPMTKGLLTKALRKLG